MNNLQKKILTTYTIQFGCSARIEKNVVHEAKNVIMKKYPFQISNYKKCFLFIFIENEIR